MNIDPKSETQKPVCAKCGGKGYYQVGYSITSQAVCECQRFSNTTLDAQEWNFNQFKALQSENQRLTEENAALKEYSDNEIQKLQRLLTRYSNQDVVISNHQVQIERLTKINEELVSFLEEMQDSNYPGCNHTIPGQWKNKGKELIEKSKPLNHEQS